MYKKLIFCGLVSASVSAAQVHFDPPDLAYELELYRQYLASRDGRAAPRVDLRTESYGIQSKETLRELSEMLYGDANYWPRVWAQSRSISKSYLIRAGHTLQFRLGTEDEMPAFRISEEEEHEPGLELVARKSYYPLIEIPPPEVPPKPVLEVPSSFPEWQQVFRRQEPPKLDDRGLVADRLKPPDKIFLSAFVQEKELEPAGFFLEGDKESTLPVPNQYLYIKMKKGVGRVGQKLMIVKDKGLLNLTSDRLLNDEVEAHLIQVTGELEITEAVTAEFSSSRDREEFEAFRALMTKSTGLSVRGSQLIVGELPIVDLKPTGQTASVNAQIIGSERHESSALYGPGDIVFLDKGSGAGLEPGQMLDLFINRMTRNPGTPVEYSPVPSGKLKVVRVTNLLATAVILQSRDSVLQGDKVQQVSSRRDEEKLEVESRKEDFEDFLDEEDGDYQIDFGEGESSVEDELDGLDEF